MLKQPFKNHKTMPVGKDTLKRIPFTFPFCLPKRTTSEQTKPRITAKFAPAALYRYSEQSASKTTRAATPLVVTVKN
ncbi:hypothetical protein [Bacillus subtilis]|uniref:hypothetical protein n=1 Tax=Bacillus subtilis TaxID=1423 RepID=UPI001BDBA023|nr:hypothetical protein [Bacillus subtilis]